MEPIISRETIRDLARKAAERSENVNVANPYPADTAAHLSFERDYWVAVRDLEIEAVV